MGHRVRYRLALLITLSAALVFSACSTAPSSTASMEPRTPINAPFVLVEGLPVVTVDIGGKKLSLVIDTGADAVGIGLAPSALQGLDVRFGGVKKSIDINGRLRVERKFVIPSMEMGDTTLAEVAGSEDLRDFLPTDGIIGNTVLSRFIVFLDYREGRAVLYPPGARVSALDEGEWIAVPFKRSAAGIMLDCAWSGGRGRFCFDTGSSTGIVAARRVQPSDIVGEQNIGDAMGGVLPTAALSDFSIAGAAFGTVELVVKDLGGLPFDGIIGYNVLRDGRVIVDFTLKKLHFSRG
jgi:hypothetical protein